MTDSSLVMPQMLGAWFWAHACCGMTFHGVMGLDLHYFTTFAISQLTHFNQYISRLNTVHFFK